MPGPSRVRLTGEWKALAQTLSKMGSPALWTAASSQAMGREAHRLRGIIIKGFNAQGPKGVKWKKLAHMTIALRRAMGFRGTKALMRSGDLRNSIKVVEEGSEDWFVGVHRTARSKTGQPLVDIATVHELGSKGEIRIKVTPKMRRFFMAMFLKTTSVAHRRRMSKSARTGKPGRGRMPKFAIMPLSPSTKVLVIRIPARPFIGPVWDSEKDTSAANVINGTLRNMGLGKFVKGFQR